MFHTFVVKEKAVNNELLEEEAHFTFFFLSKSRRKVYMTKDKNYFLYEKLTIGFI